GVTVIFAPFLEAGMDEAAVRFIQRQLQPEVLIGNNKMSFQRKFFVGTGLQAEQNVFSAAAKALLVAFDFPVFGFLPVDRDPAKRRLEVESERRKCIGSAPGC